MRETSRSSMTWCLFAVFLVAGCGTAELPDGTEEGGERCDSCPGDCGFCDTYCARPVITSAAIWDIREADVGWPFNGRNGYPYFTVANGKKVGNVARRLDNQFFDTDVYASNFQGP